MQPFPSVSNSTSSSPPPHLVSFVPSASPRSSHSSRHHVRNTGAIYPPDAISCNFRPNQPRTISPILTTTPLPRALPPGTRCAFSKNKPTFSSRTYLCEIFPAGITNPSYPRGPRPPIPPAPTHPQRRIPSHAHASGCLHRPNPNSASRRAIRCRHAISCARRFIHKARLTPTRVFHHDVAA